MANRLTMAKINAIDTLQKSGYSRRKIAALLGVDRETVGKYVDELETRPNAPTGTQPSQDATKQARAASARSSPGPQGWHGDRFRDTQPNSKFVDLGLMPCSNVYLEQGSLSSRCSPASTSLLAVQRRLDHSNANRPMP